jgi:hypothetical protein
MAQLEFLFIEAFHDIKHGIPNLEDQIAQPSTLFVQAVSRGLAQKGQRTLLAEAQMPASELPSRLQ